ncbi:Uncharacterised protein [Vibrio cholerae]|nr:Uncharacterised protein [Vibrio cholerae]CSI11296.1 Uncharacterised protein [Vibrio cholerae]
MPDSETANDALNMIPSHSANSRKSTVVSEPLPIGKLLKLKTTSWIIFKWPSLTRKNSVASNIKS